MKLRHNAIFSLARFVVDTVVIYMCFLLGYWFRFTLQIPPVTKGIPSFVAYQKVIPIIILIWALVFYHFDFYNWKKISAGLDEFFRVVKGVTLGTIIVMAITFLYREFSYSRVMVAYAWLFSSILIYCGHELIRSIEQRVTVRNLLVVGNGKIARGVRRTLKEQRNMKYHFIDTGNTDLAGFVKSNKIDEVILAKSPVNHQEVLNIERVCEQNGVEFRFMPDILELRMGEVNIDSYLGFPVLELKPLALVGINGVVKRLFDVFLSLGILMVMIIPGIIIAFLIRLDSPGPVFYKQLRKGFRGRSFTFLKFRTMVKNAEEIFEELKSKSERGGPVFKMKKDPRVTRIGRFLRRYSIDEIPQILNVIRGEMSLVGPRPQVLWETEHYDEEAKRRLHVLPGITGPWQIRGRSELSYDEMIKLDIWYLENWSLGLDIKMLLGTIPAVFARRGAY